MKKLLLLFCFFSFQSIFSQNILDFDLKDVELQGMKPAKIDQKMKKIGIAQNPFMTDNPEVISKLDRRENSDLIKKFYTFIYNDSDGDGGVVVSQFENKEDLNAYLATVFEQSNYRVLVKDLFLIRVWSDHSLDVEGRETSEDHLNKLEKYYTNLGAKKVTLKVDESIITVVE